MTYFLDTNVFLRVLAEDDVKSLEECKGVLKKVKESEIEAVTASLVLVEVAWTLESYYGWEKGKVVRSLKSIVHLGGLKVVDRYRPETAVERYEAKGVKFVDAMIASIPEVEARVRTVISYDRDFDKLGVLRLEPRQVI